MCQENLQNFQKIFFISIDLDELFTPNSEFRISEDKRE